jgi:hypothetical protein
VQCRALHGTCRAPFCEFAGAAAALRRVGRARPPRGSASVPGTCQSVPGTARHVPCTGRKSERGPLVTLPRINQAGCCLDRPPIHSAGGRPEGAAAAATAQERTGGDSNSRYDESRIQHFQCCSFNRSDTCPRRVAKCTRTRCPRDPPGGNADAGTGGNDAIPSRVNAQRDIFRNNSSAVAFRNQLMASCEVSQSLSPPFVRGGSASGWSRASHRVPHKPRAATT